MRLWLRKDNPSAWPQKLPWSRFLPLGCYQYQFTGKKWWHGRDVGPSLAEEVWEAWNWILYELRKEGPLDGMTRQARLLSLYLCKMQD